MKKGLRITAPPLFIGTDSLAPTHWHRTVVGSRFSGDGCHNLARCRGIADKSAPTGLPQAYSQLLGSMLLWEAASAAMGARLDTGPG
jgi:hypothetical protein